MKITVVRHGQTTGNLSKIVESRIGGKLTEKGVEQANQTGERLKHETFDVIYSSDMQRCVDTTHIIMKYLPDVQLILRDDIRELSKGSFDGGLWSDLPDYIHTDTYITEKIGGGESWMAMEHRVRNFLREIYSPDQQILIVTHEGVLKIMHAILDKVPLSNAIQIAYDNAGVYEWQVNEPIPEESMK